MRVCCDITGMYDKAAESKNNDHGDDADEDLFNQPAEAGRGLCLKP